MFSTIALMKSEKWEHVGVQVVFRMHKTGVWVKENAVICSLNNELKSATEWYIFPLLLSTIVPAHFSSSLKKLVELFLHYVVKVLVDLEKKKIRDLDLETVERLVQL